MKKWFLSLGALALVGSAATAQTIPSSIGDFLYQLVYDDNDPETSFKIFYPSAAGEGLNVDLNTDGAGMTVMAISVQAYISSGSETWKYVGLFPDNLTVDPSGRTPDLGNPMAVLNNPTGGPASGGAYCLSFTHYDIPDTQLGTAGAHIALANVTGDSGTWLCTDFWDASGANHTGTRHSFFTTDDYATPASYPFSKWNWMVRASGAPPTPNGGTFLINGGTNVVQKAGTTITMSFWSADTSAPTLYVQYLKLGLSFIALPAMILQTGQINFVPGPIQQLGQLSGIAPCAAVGLTLDFTAFFSDNLDKKPNGQNKIKLANTATVFFKAYKACTPNICFGIRDDGTLDGGIYNPHIWSGFGSAAGSKDVSTNNQGFVSPIPPAVTNLTAVEVNTWDFCGNACWQAVGIYPANTVLDPTGNSPDMNNPFTSLGSASACSGLGAYTGVWGFPAQVYDTPDIAANTTTLYHSSVMYLNNDSCLYVAMDLGGTADDAGDDCADILGAYAFYSLDGMVTPGVSVGYNLMIRLNWN